MRDPRAAIALGISLSIPCAAVAETAIETITVIASRVPDDLDRAVVPVEVIDRAALERRDPTDLGDLLRGHSGISVSRAGGPGQLAEVRLRGAEANHLLVTIDGIELNDPATGSSVDFVHLGVTGVERVELLRGASSALWGSDALAGVLHLDTTPPADTRVRRLGTALGSFGTWGATADAADAGDAWYYALSAQHRSTDGTNVALSGGEDDGYRSTTWHLNTGYRGEVAGVRVVARETRADVDLDPTPFPDFTPADGDLEQSLRHRLGGVEVRVDTTPSWRQRVSTSIFDSSNTSRDGGVRTGATAGRRVHFGYQSEWQPGGGKGSRLTLAAEFERESFHQRGIPTDFGDPNQHQTIDQLAAIAEWSILLPASVRLVLSARHDDNSEYADSDDFRVATRIPIATRGTLFASYGTGAKNPTFTERFGYTPDTFFGNPALRPEQSTSLDAGFEQPIGDSATVRFAWFRDRLSDEIASFVFDPIRNGFTAINESGRSRRTGFESGIAWSPLEPLEITAQYSVLDATEPGETGQEEEVRRPRHTGGLRLDWTPSAAVAVQIGGAYVGRHRDFDFATFPAARVPLADYTLLHCAARWRATEHVTLSARVENATDTDYRDVFGYASPGRAFTLGFEGQFR